MMRFSHTGSSFRGTNLLASIAAGTLIAVSPTGVLAQSQSNSGFDQAGGVLKEETRTFFAPCIFKKPAPKPKEKAPEAGKTPEDLQGQAPVKKSKLLFLDSAVIASAVAAPALDFGIAALKAAAEEKSIQAFAAFPANGWFYQMQATGELQVHPKLRCIHVISGSFWDGIRVSENEGTAATATIKKSEEDKAEFLAKLLSPEQIDTVPNTFTRISDTHEPLGRPIQVLRGQEKRPVLEAVKDRYRQIRWVRMFFEARLDQPDGPQGVFTLAPNALFFDKPIDSSFFDGLTASRNILVTLTLAKAGIDKSFATVAFPFREVEEGTFLSPLYFTAHASRALTVPSPDDDEKKALEKADATLTKAKRALAPENPKYKEPPSYEAPDLITNPDYVNALAVYCKEVMDYNEEAKKKKLPRLAAADCPVSVRKAKLQVDTAAKAVSKLAMVSEREFNAKNYKAPGGWENVVCAPSAEGDRWTPNCSLKEPIDATYITASASVTEIREANKFIAFLGAVSEKMRPAIDSALKAQLPENNATAQEQSKVDKEKFELAKADVAVAEAKLAAAADADKPQKERDLLAAKIAANQAARKAGEAEPYPIP